MRAAWVPKRMSDGRKVSRRQAACAAAAVPARHHWKPCVSFLGPDEGQEQVTACHDDEAVWFCWGATGAPPLEGCSAQPFGAVTGRLVGESHDDRQPSGGCALAPRVPQRQQRAAALVCGGGAGAGRAPALGTSPQAARRGALHHEFQRKSHESGGNLMNIDIYRAKSS